MTIAVIKLVEVQYTKSTFDVGELSRSFHNVIAMRQCCNVISDMLQRLIVLVHICK